MTIATQVTSDSLAIGVSPRRSNSGATPVLAYLLVVGKLPSCSGQLSR